MEDTVKEKVDPDYNAVMEERRRVFADDFVEITHTLGVMWQKLKKIRDCDWDTSLRDAMSDIKALVRISYMKSLSVENDFQLKAYINRNCVEVSKELQKEIKTESKKFLEARERELEPNLSVSEPIATDCDNNELKYGDRVIVTNDGNSKDGIIRYDMYTNKYRAFLIHTLTDVYPTTCLLDDYNENYTIKKVEE